MQWHTDASGITGNTSARIKEDERISGAPRNVENQYVRTIEYR